MGILSKKPKTTKKAAAPAIAEPAAPRSAHANPHHVVLGVLVRPHMSEKAHVLGVTRNQYIFVVHDDANKNLVREAIQDQYKVTVESVNIVREPGKQKRWRNVVGKHPRMKKAIVTVKAGQKIEII
jgi:large subunit ribosomal protein L23